MYAVIRSGGKQYRVVPGETVRVEKLAGKVGSKVAFDEVLAVHGDDKKLLSRANSAKAKVTGKIVSQGRGAKSLVLKYKRGGQYKITRGHRQAYTAVEVNEIKVE